MELPRIKDLDSTHQPSNSYYLPKPPRLRTPPSSKTTKLTSLSRTEPKTDRTPRTQYDQPTESLSPREVLRKDSFNLGSPTTHRLQTLRIFQQRSEVILPSQRHEGGRRGPDGQIKYGDSFVTIKTLIKEGRKEYSKKKKKNQAKGTMYVNDLWAKGYQKEVVKQAGIDTDLESEKKAQTHTLKKQLTKISHLPRTIQEYGDTTPKKNNSSRSPSHGAAGDSFSNSLHNDASQQKPRNLEPLKIQEEDEDEDQYGFKPKPEARTAVPRRSRLISQSNEYQIKTDPSPQKDSSLSFSQFIKTSANIEESRMAQSSYSKGMLGVASPVSMKHSQYGLTPRAIIRETETSKRQPRQIITRHGVKPSTKVGSLAEYDSRLSSREGSVEQKSSSLSRELEATRTKLFLEGTNSQVNQLIGHCEMELSERDDWVKLIYGLKGLFLNEKYDKVKKDEYQQKIRLISECRSLLKKRNQNRWDPL